MGGREGGREREREREREIERERERGGKSRKEQYHKKKHGAYLKSIHTSQYSLTLNIFLASVLLFSNSNLCYETRFLLHATIFYQLAIDLKYTINFHTLMYM